MSTNLENGKRKTDTKIWRRHQARACVSRHTANFAAL